MVESLTQISEHVTKKFFSFNSQGQFFRDN